MTSNAPANVKEIVMPSWGDNPPQWIMQMADECNRSSQSSVAKKMGRSPSLVNMVLRKKYSGDMEDVKGRFEAAFMTGAVQCPVLGEISGPDCLKNQAKPYNPGNHMAVRLFVGCKNCPFNQCKKGGHNGNA